MLVAFLHISKTKEDVCLLLWQSREKAAEVAQSHMQEEEPADRGQTHSEQRHSEIYVKIGRKGAAEWMKNVLNTSTQRHRAESKFDLNPDFSCPVRIL